MPPTTKALFMYTRPLHYSRALALAGFAALVFSNACSSRAPGSALIDRGSGATSSAGGSDRISALEAEIADLRSRISTLEEELRQFKAQFGLSA